MKATTTRMKYTYPKPSIVAEMLAPLIETSIATVAAVRPHHVEEDPHEFMGVLFRDRLRRARRALLGTHLSAQIKGRAF